MHCAADPESLTEVIVVRGLTFTDDCRDRRASVAVLPATEQRSVTAGSARRQLSGNSQLPTCVRFMLAGGLPS
jgi:hypothetical protein